MKKLLPFEKFNKLQFPRIIDFWEIIKKNIPRNSLWNIPQNIPFG